MDIYIASSQRGIYAPPLGGTVALFNQDFKNSEPGEEWANLAKAFEEQNEDDINQLLSHLKESKQLVEVISSSNKGGDTLFHIAAQKGHKGLEPLLKLLPDAVKELFLNRTNLKGETPKDIAKNFEVQVGAAFTPPFEPQSPPLRQTPEPQPMPLASLPKEVLANSPAESLERGWMMQQLKSIKD